MNHQIKLEEYLINYGINSLSELRKLRQGKTEVVCGMPSKSLKLISLIMSVFLHSEFLPKKNILFVISERNIWSEDFDKLGERCIEMMLGVKIQDSEPVVVEFEEHERQDLVAFALSCSIFQWDAYILPKNDKSFIFLDHDGLVRLYTEDQDRARLAMRDFDSWVQKSGE